MYECDPEPIHLGLISPNSGNLEVGKQQRIGLDLAELGTWSSRHNGGASGARTPQSHKASQYRFLTWVAYTRNLHPGVTEKQQRTCPMVGCQQEFPLPEFMLRHVKTCSLLSKGHYWCFESEKEERIGKCDTEACVELKGGIVNAMSTSFRSMKRHLSGRRSKSHQLPEDSARNSAVYQETSHLDSPWDLSLGVSELPHDVQYMEMGTSFSSATQGEDETNTNFGRSELHATDSPSPWSAGEGNQPQCPSSYPDETNIATLYDQEQHHHHPTPTQPGINFVRERTGFAIHDGKRWQLSSLLNAGNTQTPFSKTTIYEQFEPAELHASSVASLVNDNMQRYNQGSSPSSSQFSADGGTGMFEPTTLDIDHPASSFHPSHAHQTYQASRSPTHHTEAVKYSDKLVIDDYLCKADSHVSSNASYTNLRRGSQMDSTTSSDSGSARSMFSTISTMSNANRSMTSYNSSIVGLNDCQYTSTPFFEDSSILFEEPESIESLALYQKLSSQSNNEITTTQRTDAQGVSIDNYIEPGSYLFKNPHITYPPLTRVDNMDKSSEAISLTTTPTPMHPSTCPESSSPPSTSDVSPASPPRRAPRKVACRLVCGSMVDISNRSRHEKRCKSNPTRSQGARLRCLYPGCHSTFDRKDNLKQHQDAQNHWPIENVELQLRINTTPGSPTWDLAMNALGQRSRPRHVKRGRR